MNQKTAAFNANILAGIQRAANDPIERSKLAESMGDYTRTGIYEASFIHRILPVEKITNSDLRDTFDESLSVMKELQPQSGPASFVPFATMPKGDYMTSSKYIIPLYKVMTDEMKKDTDELRNVKMNLQQYLMDDMIRQGVELIDGKFLTHVNGILDDSDKYGVQSSTGKQQVVAFADAFKRETVVDAFNLMFRGSTFKGMERMYRLNTKVALVSRATLNEIAKWNRQDMGGDMAQTNIIDGVQTARIMGVDIIATLKNNLVPDNWMYCFTSPEFLGHNLELRGWTTFTEQRDTVISFYSHWLGGIGIGNIAGVTLAKFNQPTE